MLFLNRSFDKKRLKALLLWFRLNLSEGAALKAVEILQELGFRSATQGAISLGLDDLKTPTSKSGRVFQAQVEVALAHHEHHRGNRTPVELFQHLVDTWHRTSQDLTTEVVQLFHSTERVNPVYMMAFSGARGNISQVRQLVGMRGLMADPRGQIVGFPILSNFREGLTITEYFVSCYGARKGVVDTAIRTADAGYLTRRLADVSHHVVVRTTNCGTHRNIRLRDIKEGEKIILSLANRLVGRVLAEHILLAPKTIIYCNSEITPSIASTIASQHSEVPVRSPLSCSLPWGVCQLCYGWGLSEGRRVTLGEAVGIIAAQSIGEPGTQLTLRTFHTGGVFSGELLNEIRAPYAGNVFFPKPLQGLLLRTPHGQIAFLTKVSGKMKISELLQNNLSTVSTAVQREALPPIAPLKSKALQPIISLEKKKDHEFFIQSSTVIFVKQKEYVYPNQLLAEFSSSTLQSANDQIEITQQVLSETAGQVWFKEIDYGSRKGPGSGSLGTHFSSQKLGGIWVLAGKPMPNTLAFFNYRPSNQQKTILFSPIDSINLSTHSTISTVSTPVQSEALQPITESPVQSKALQPFNLVDNFPPLRYFVNNNSSNFVATSVKVPLRSLKELQTVGLHNRYASQNKYYSSLLSEYRNFFQEKYTKLSYYTLGYISSQFFCFTPVPLRVSQTQSTSVQSKALQPITANGRTLSSITDAKHSFASSQLPISLPIQLYKTYRRYTKSKDKIVSNKQIFSYEQKVFKNRNLSKSEFSGKQTSVLNLQEDFHVLKYNYVLGYVLVTEKESNRKQVATELLDLLSTGSIRLSMQNKKLVDSMDGVHQLSTTKSDHSLLATHVVIDQVDNRLADLLPIKSNASETSTKFTTQSTFAQSEALQPITSERDRAEIYIRKLALRSVLFSSSFKRQAKNRKIEKQSFVQKKENLYKKLFRNLEHRNVGALLLPRKTLTSFEATHIIGASD